MGFQAWISAVPWDVMDEGVGDVLDRLHGELGATGVALHVALPPVTELRASDVEPRVFRTRGGLFFQPAPNGYEGTRCKPVVSTWLRGRNPLGKVAAACAARGLGLRVVVSAAMTGRMVGRHPEMASKNVFGSESRMGLCLSNPDVQTYLCSLTTDLSSNYELAELALADYWLGWPEASERELEPSWALGEGERRLLSLCFCESCHQHAARAGVDVAFVKRSAASMIDRGLADGGTTGADLGTLLCDDPSLAAYVRSQGATMTALLRRIKASCTCVLLAERSPDASAPHGDISVDWSIPDAVITAITDSDELPLALCASALRNELRLPAAVIARRGGQDVVSTVAAAVRLGFAGVQFDPFGLLPPAALTAVKQAIRFARRSARG